MNLKICYSAILVSCFVIQMGWISRPLWSLVSVTGWVTRNMEERKLGFQLYKFGVSLRDFQALLWNDALTFVNQVPFCNSILGLTCICWDYINLSVDLLFCHYGRIIVPPGCIQGVCNYLGSWRQFMVILLWFTNNLNWWTFAIIWASFYNCP